MFPHAGPAVVMSADLICCGVQLGCSSTSSATAPVTCGADMLVPSKTENWEGSSAFVTEERMSPPGADTSGFSWWPKAVGPAEEKKVTTPSRSVWIWRMAVSIRICPRPCEPASASLSRCPSRSEIIPEGTAISTGMPLGVPARLFTSTSPIPPASFTRAAFETKLQKPRETSAIEPVSEPAGSGLYAPFGSLGRPQRCRSTGVPSRPTIVPMSVSCCALNAHVLGMLGAIPRWNGIVLRDAGQVGRVQRERGREDVLVRDRGDRDRFGRGAGAAVGAEAEVVAVVAGGDDRDDARLHDVGDGLHHRVVRPDRSAARRRRS